MTKNVSFLQMQEELYRARRGYQGNMDDGSISFNAGQDIVVMDKSQGRRWVGRLADQNAIGWFPAECVQKVFNNDKQIDTVQLAGSKIGKNTPEQFRIRHIFTPDYYSASACSSNIVDGIVENFST